jgi:hypothetical protein
MILHSAEIGIVLKYKYGSFSYPFKSAQLALTDPSEWRLCVVSNGMDSTSPKRHLCAKLEL